MDTDGYPDQKELDRIKKWDYNDVFALIDYIGSLWAYRDWGFKIEWGKDRFYKKPVLFWELHTAGWSGNESIMEALFKNKWVKEFFHTKWERGGHFYFEVNPETLGYQPVSEYTKNKGCSRQYVYHNKEKFLWIHAGDKTKFIKLKK